MFFKISKILTILAVSLPFVWDRALAGPGEPGDSSRPSFRMQLEEMGTKWQRVTHKQSGTTHQTPSKKKISQEPSGEQTSPAGQATADVSPRDHLEPLPENCGSQLLIPASSMGQHRDLVNFTPPDFLRSFSTLFDIPDSYLFETLVIRSLENYEAFNISVEDFVTWLTLHHQGSIDISETYNPFNLSGGTFSATAKLLKGKRVVHNSLANLYLQYEDPQRLTGANDLKLREFLDKYLLVKLDGLYPYLVIDAFIFTTKEVCQNKADIYADKSKRIFAVRIKDPNLLRVCSAINKLFEDKKSSSFQKQRGQVLKLLGRLMETLLISLTASDPQTYDNGKVNKKSLKRKPFQVSKAITTLIDEIHSEYEMKLTGEQLKNEDPQTLGNQLALPSPQASEPLDLSSEESETQIRFRLSEIHKTQTQLSQTLSSLSTLHFPSLNLQKEKLQNHIKNLTRGEEYFSTTSEINGLNEIIEQRDKKLESLHEVLESLISQIAWMEASLETGKGHSVAELDTYKNAQDVLNSIKVTFEGLQNQVTAHQDFNQNILSTTSKLLLGGSNESR